jgi:hypothetical protein
MSLIRPHELDGDALAYRLFQISRDQAPWRAEDIILAGRLTRDPERAELAWRFASRGYYAEQAGLVAAATLAVHTEDAPLRFSLAAATADEARHADAFYRYAKTVGGEPEECQELVEPLDDALVRLPHMGRALVHTMLEGFAADQFILLGEYFAGDPLGEIYRHVRRDEVRHIAIGLSYLARESATRAGRDIWLAHADEWHDIGMGLTYLSEVSESLGEWTNRDPVMVQEWFLRRHRTRLRAAGIELAKGGELP